jgi:uncharacterized integral membrane protein
MSFERDSFVRCYIEAWFHWIVLNAVGGIAFWLMGTLLQRPVKPGPFAWFTDAARDPLILIVVGVLVIPLLTAILVGSRRNIHGRQ